MRVVGDPNLRVHTVGANWGYAGSLRPFARPDLDVLIIGEAREWERAFTPQDREQIGVDGLGGGFHVLGCPWSTPSFKQPQAV